ERRLEHWPTAEAAFRRTLAIAPGHLGAERGLAFSLFMQGRIDDAQRIYAPLAAATQLDADAFYALGVLADRAGDRPGAIANYRAALDSDPRHARARYGLALDLQQSGELDAAIREYKTVKDTPPVDLDALYNLAVACWQKGDRARALHFKGELTRRSPTYPGLDSLGF